MKFVSNEGKTVEIKVNENIYMRHAIKTRFVKPGDDYIEIFREYALPIYKEGDIISSSEKIISLCQNRIVKRDDLKVGFWAKTLSKFASRSSAGIGISEPYKMQYAINKAGLIKVIFASIASAITKIFKIKGVFYKIVGQEISGLDGFYGDVWNEYGDIGIENPIEPTRVCNEIKRKLGISCMIVDANDLGQVILGKSDDIRIKDEILREMIKDNPAGQGKQMTPLILIRKKSEEEVL